MAEGFLVLLLLLVVLAALGVFMSKRMKNLASEDASDLATSGSEPVTWTNDRTTSNSQDVRTSPIAHRSPPPPPHEHQPRPIAQKPVPEVASTPATLTQRKIFLSYRREDSADVAGRIYDRLTQAFEKAQVFKDVDSIPLGVDFRKHLQQTVSSCDVVLVVMGNDWLRTTTADGNRRIDNPKDFVRIEVETALQRNIPVIPVLVRGAEIPGETDLPTDLSALAYRNGIAVRSDPDFHRDMDRLVQSLKTHMAGASAAT